MKNLNYDKLAFEFQTTSITLTQMAKREQIDRRTLSSHFKKLGIEVINKQNRTKFDNHIFDVIDTEEKAYWLGFIFADGYIGSTPLRPERKSVYNFEISLKADDVEHLKKFKSFISWEKDVVVDNNRCRIMLVNKHFWNVLNDYGCTPKKSLTLKFPDISIFKSSDLIRHFIRGYFDGDGCFSRYVYIHTVTPHVQIIGTPQFLKEIEELINMPVTYRHDPRHTEDTMIMDFNKDSTVKFINYLYSNSTVYLDRKYKLFEFFKDGSRSVKEFAELLGTNIGERL